MKPTGATCYQKHLKREAGGLVHVVHAASPEAQNDNVTMLQGHDDNRQSAVGIKQSCGQYITVMFSTGNIINWD